MTQSSLTKAPTRVVPIWKSIAPMRGIAMCLVVANHAVQAASAAYAGSHATLSPHTAFALFAPVWIVRSLTPACLVLFMFASGFVAYRFFNTSGAAWNGATQLLRKYLAWSLVLYALDAAFEGGLQPRQVLLGLVRGEAEPAYWFLVALAVLYLGAPLWVWLVKVRPRLAVTVGLTVQVISCVAFYLFERQHPHPPGALEALLVRPHRFLPALLLGMLASREASSVAGWLAAHRRSLMSLAWIFGVAALAEPLLIGARAGFRIEVMPAMYATERASLVAFGFTCTALLLGTDFGRARSARFMAEVGNASLGVMLLMDVSMATVLRCLWQLPRFVWPAAAHAFAHHELPDALARAAIWLTPVFFAVGLWGPLVIMHIARRSFGARARWLW